MREWHFFSQVLEFGFEFADVSPSNLQNTSTITPSVNIDGTSGAIMSEPASAREFDRLVQSHLEATLRMAIRLTGNLHTAEDVVQESLVKAARHWQSFRRDASFRTWLYRIVINTLHDFRTAEGRRQPVSQPMNSTPIDHTRSGPDHRILQEELADMVAQRVSALPPRQREVLVLTAYEGLSIAETAATLELSEANVHSTLHIARNRLREELRPYLQEKA
ncbi:RNA polymerase sigma factor [Thalassoroseus pseudoceratinae]|uniref:RNA polymerase sigma factor n=1 Tax=Thalassoroseus pseudoceratinae TaxID=2713176 RepID=UPI0014240739|nr:RNA polymerase sigma factor [Thalassoroseus pseudoceratinae]